MPKSNPLITRPNRYWRMADVRAVDAAQDFADLLPVALRVISRMPLDRPRTIVSGPITTGGEGTVEKNTMALKLAIELLQKKGFNVFDQFPFQDAMTRMLKVWHAKYGHKKYCAKLITDFYGPMLEHENVIHSMIQLPGWRTSNGAVMEFNIFNAALPLRRAANKEVCPLSIAELPGDWKTNLAGPGKYSVIVEIEKRLQSFS